MKIVCQKEKFLIQNCDSIDPSALIQRKNFSRHGKLFPQTVRCLIVGSSNSGKTNVLTNLLTQENGLGFENLYIYSKSLQQPKYVFLKEVCSGIPGLGYHEFSEFENIIPSTEVKPNSIIIFDDIATGSSQNIIKDYFSRGRHWTIDSIFLCQTYAYVSKQLIRDNANFLILFSMDETNLSHIYRDHVSADMKFEEFKDLCRLCWKERFDFVVIDKDRDIKDGRYRKKFDSFIYL